MDNLKGADSTVWSSSDSTASDGDEVPPLSVPLTDKHQLLKLRLGPLRRVEADLKKRLGAGTEEIVGTDTEGSGRSRTKEFGVRALKDALGILTNNGAADGEQQTDEATEVIASCKDDMKTLWTDEAVRTVLTKRRMRVEDSAGLLVVLFGLFYPCVFLTVYP
jgi:guanine nucleotide-binding protein subunit alpha